MARCPWFAHDVVIDPAHLKLKKGQGGVCQYCHLRYIVTRVTPSYRLKRDVHGSAATIYTHANKPKLKPSHYQALAKTGPLVAAFKKVGFVQTWYAICDTEHGKVVSSRHLNNRAATEAARDHALAFTPNHDTDVREEQDVG